MHTIRLSKDGHVTSSFLEAYKHFSKYSGRVGKFLPSKRKFMDSKSQASCIE
jgi:hypothetical protein